MLIKSGAAALLLLALTLSTARSQRLEPGYLVLSSGDTLRGEVENAFWTDPPTTVRFRPGPAADLTTYRARQLRAVHFNSGRLFRRELLPIDYYAVTRASQAPYGLTIRQTPDSLLADVLVEGPATLLSVVWDQVHHYFVRREDKTYLEMTERRYLDNRGPVVRIVDGNNYRGQLEMYFGDCPPAVAASRTAQFKAQDLIGVVQVYNQQCSATRRPGRQIEVTAPVVSHMKLQFGPLAGLRYTSMRPRATSEAQQELRTLDGVQLGGRLRPQVGAYLDLLQAGRRLAVHSALSVHQFGGTTALKSPNGDPRWNGRMDWEGTNLTLQLGLRGRQPLSENLYAFVGTGLEFIALLNERGAVSYGPGTGSRAVGGAQVATGYGFNVGYGANKLPYLEVGVQHRRLSVMLNGRLYGKEYYYDPFVVSAITSQNGVILYSGYEYQARTATVALVLSYQLNGDADKRRR